MICNDQRADGGFLSISSHSALNDYGVCRPLSIGDITEDANFGTIKHSFSSRMYTYPAMLSSVSCNCKSRFFAAWMLLSRMRIEE